MMRTRTALVGCGKVGLTHALALAGLAESEFVAVCDADAARAKAMGERFGVGFFADVATMVREAAVQAVLIATPHPLHAAPAIAAAENGAHVLVEKPLAASLADCDAMLAAARRADVLLSVISQRRLYEPVLRIKAAIDAGKIGRPALGVFTMYSWRDEAYYRSDPWRGRWDTEGGGVLVNQSPHQLDLLLWFMGPIADVSGAWANVNHPGVEVDDTAVATIRFKNGGLGAVITSVAQNPGIYTKVQIHGTNGASVGVQTDTGATFVAGMTGIAAAPFNDVWTIPGEESLLEAFQADDRARFAQVDAASHYHRLQIQDFLQAIQTGRPPMVSADEGRAVVEFFSAIYRSHQERRAVRMEQN